MSRIEQINYWKDISDDDLRSREILIEPLNIEARYPTHKDRLLKSLNEAKCVELIDQTRKVQQWIKMRL